MRSEPKSVRPPAVAGQFYPREPLRLTAEVRDFLAGVRGGTGAPPKAVIAPHAGYMYSGAVAGAAFAQLGPAAEAISRVVVIGPAHYVPFDGIAVPSVHAFETPIGRIEVDREAISALADLDFVEEADHPHAPEHALEVELPFLQAVVQPFSIVPLLVGDATPQEVAEALGRVWGGAETLIVVSSDLSHYHDYDTARQLDARTAQMIEGGDWSHLAPGNACGYLPVAGLLIEANRRKLEACRLALCSSGDTAGSRDRVVGYGAWAFAAPH